ncbi:MAG TPA: DUF2851 family protein [Prolixibacteraceae bacterium]|nr:DUF2851 family protein [Prolixibacteraceae bacterium]
MPEEFMQYVWKYQLFSNEKLQTTDGDQVTVINPGTWNFDAGPDFFNASVKIGDTTWAGNIEVHGKSSDWLRHNHQTNEAYNNVILHVVLENDVSISLPNGQRLPALQMQIAPNVAKNYKQLLAENEKPACHNYLESIDPIYIRSTIDSMLVERLQGRTITIEGIMALNKNDWNETFYQLLARNFGFKVNALPFEMLSRSLPLRVLAHHTGNLFQTEALLFGQSGMLNEQLLGDDYFIELRNEYSYLANKYKLKGMEGHVWKFMRMRPANFPSLRIAQFAALVHRSKSLLSKLIECNSPNEIIDHFRVKASGYWDTHYRFNQPSIKQVKNLGESSRNNIIINTVVPFLYIYGDRNNKPELKSRALVILELIAPEQNQIISTWDKYGVKAESAYDTQALIQLRNGYCEPKKCLRCPIGAKVIKPGVE